MTVSQKYLEFISLVQALNTIVFGDDTAEVTLDGITKPSISKFLAQVDALTTAELQRLRDAINVVMNQQSVPTTIVTDGTHSQEWINSDLRAALQALNDRIDSDVPIVVDATTIDKGVVRLATESDITNSSETAVVTAKNVAAMLVGVGSLAKGFRALFSARLTQMTGTNTSNGKTITCNITAHGLSVGNVVSVNYGYKTLKNGQQSATDTVTVTSVADANNFTFTSPQNADSSGSAVACTLYYAIKNNYNVNSLAINSAGRYTISINAASGITGANFIPFIQATTSDNSVVLVQPEAITSATSLTVRTFNASGVAIAPQWLHIGVTQ